MHKIKKRKARIIKSATRWGKIPSLVGAAGAQKNQPRAQLIQTQEGGTQIEILCPCGNKIVVECESE